MKTVNMGRLADPGALREFSPRALVAMMDDSRDFLANKGFVLPPLPRPGTSNIQHPTSNNQPGNGNTAPQSGEGGEIELDYEALAQVFVVPAEIPQAVVERFHMVREMSRPQQLTRILDAVAERQLALPLPRNECSPADFAAFLLLQNREVFQELYAEMGSARYRRYVHFVPRRKRARLELPADFQALERTLNGWYEAHHCDRTARVYAKQQGPEYVFVVRRGDPIKRQGCLDLSSGQSRSEIFRPERFGRVIYHEATGELRVHGHSEGETELFRLAFGLHLFSDGNHFPRSSRKYTLDPLLTAGRAALTCAGFPDIVSVRLTEIGYRHGAENGGLERIAAPDVFAWLERNKVTLPEESELRMAKFAVMFRGAAKARSFSIQPSNHATFSREEDSEALQPWLERQGFALVNQEETANETWTLEFA